MNNSIVKVNDNSLSKKERELFEYHSSKIQAGIKKGQDARNEVMMHVLSVLESDPPLWREYYSSAEEYIKTELNLEMSSFWRSIKDSKNYLHLANNTEDLDEQITLTRMRGAAFRELRTIATDTTPMLKKGSESEEDYKNRVKEKQDEDLNLIQNLWNEIYPRIREYKKTSGTGIYPNGGYSITAKDITETCAVLLRVLEIPKLIADGVPLSAITVGTLNDEDISLQEVIDTSGEDTIRVIEEVRDTSVMEALHNKMIRQTNHIRENLEKKYDYDQYEGKLVYEDGKLKVVNQQVEYDLLAEWSDLLGRDTSISVRRKRDL